MEVTRLKAERRTAKGRNQVKQIRAQGWLPAVVYGGSEQPTAIAVSEWEMEQHLRHHHRVYRLEVEDLKQDVYLQDVQWHALTDRIHHIDFKRIDLTKEIETEVEIEFLGHPVGLSKGGVLMKDYTALPVRCLPMAIPENIQITVTELDMDQALLASQVQVPAGITLLLEPDEVVCHVAMLVVHAPATPAAEVVEPEVAGAAPKAEGDAAKDKDAKDGKEKKDKA